MKRLYQHIGVAVAMTPRLEALLAESAFLARRFGGTLSLIHAGAPHEEKESRFKTALRRAGLPEGTPIHWPEGAPAAAIVEAVEHAGIDLLVAGALERENMLRFFLIGSVTRDLVRRAPCSLLLYTEPRDHPEPVRRIVVVADYSDRALDTLRKALHLAEQDQAEHVFVLRVHPPDGRTDPSSPARAGTRSEEEARLRDLVGAAGDTTVPVEAVCIEGDTGAATIEFARQQQADLLVLPTGGRSSPPQERIYPSDLEWLLREIPCNVWVAR